MQVFVATVRGDANEEWSGTFLVVGVFHSEPTAKEVAQKFVNEHDPTLSWDVSAHEVQ